MSQLSMAISCEVDQPVAVSKRTVLLNLEMCSEQKLNNKPRNTTNIDTSRWCITKNKHTKKKKKKRKKTKKKKTKKTTHNQCNTP